MKNVFLEDRCLKGDVVYIDGEYFHYLKNVRRTKRGQKFSAIINEKKYTLAVSSIENGRMVCKIVEERYISDKRDLNIRVYQGILKSKKMDLLVSKLSELGVNTLFPLKTERSICDKPLGEQRFNRWKKLVREGAKVTGDENVLEINPPVEMMKIKDFLKMEVNPVILIFSMEVSAIPLRSLLESIQPSKATIFHLFYGPEGGFSEIEINSIKDMGGHIVSLGDSVLKSETAAIVGTGFIKLYYLEKWKK